MAPVGSSKGLELRLGDGEEILATLTNGDAIYAAITLNEDVLDAYKFAYQGDDEPILITAASAVGLSVAVGDRWMKTGDLDLLDEDDIAMVVGGLCTHFLNAGFRLPDQEPVVEAAV